MTAEYPHITVKRGTISGHPWVFSSSLIKPQNPVKNGSIVDLRDNSGKFLARGLYNSHARIGLRVLSRDENEVIDAGFFKTRLEKALIQRRALSPDQFKEHRAYRLVYSEADHLSGLIIDVYGTLVVAQFFSAGMFYKRDDIFTALKELIPVEQIYFYADDHAQKQDSFNCRVPAGEFKTTIEENGVRFNVDPDINHKTGFFLDQRDNRAALAKLSKDKTVLDLCTFTGGFALAAKVAGQAKAATGIDLDPNVIVAAQANAALNHADVNFIAADIYAWLKDRENIKDGYDIVILDPAKLTKNRDKIASALYSYTEMNRLAIAAVKPGGLLLTCSCTGLVSEDAFISAVAKAGRLAKRNIQLIATSGASSDHPVLPDVPESRYLKALWFYVP